MEQAGASGPDGFANTGGLVGWEVIEDHHVALRQDDREERADMGEKGQQRLAGTTDLGRCGAASLTNLPQQFERRGRAHRKLGRRFARRDAHLSSPEQALPQVLR